MKKIITLCLIAGISFSVSAQQEATPIFIGQHYRLFNPAISLNDSSNELLITHLSSLGSIDQGPETSFLSYAKEMNENVTLGIMAMRDKVFIESQTRLAADYSYRLRLSNENVIQLGVRAQGGWYNVNINELQGIPGGGADPNLQGQGQFTFNFGFGAHYRSRVFYAGVSIPALFNSNKLEENGIEASVRERRQLFAVMGLNLEISNDLVLEPALMYRSMIDKTNIPSTVDMNLLFNYKDTFKVGAGYSTRETYSILAMFYSEFLNADIGYAYEQSLQSNLLNAAKNSSQLFVNIKMKNNRY